MDDKHIPERYKAIIGLQHPTSKKHRRMQSADRAAQFAPFAALTGHDAAIRETARLTDKKYTPDEQISSELDMKLRFLIDNVKTSGEVEIMYFLPDKKKSGGEYVEIKDSVKKFDTHNSCIIMNNGMSIPVEDIISLECDIFPDMDT